LSKEKKETVEINELMIRETNKNTKNLTKCQNSTNRPFIKDTPATGEGDGK
jgi:hypothetical protein